MWLVWLVAACLLAAASLAASVPALADGPKEIPPTFTPPPSTEISTDTGNSWSTVGRVAQPATASLMGYLASGYAQIGTVAATAVHGIRIRVGDLSTAYPAMVSIIPREFALTPNLFGGHISGDSGIYTDIFSGSSIFREFAPVVGSQVFLQGPGGGLTHLPMSYQPTVGDIVVIKVALPNNPLREVIFENKVGGNVTATYADGTAQTVTHVVKAVDGVGRFDGTSYTGVGAINTNHTGVITVSTAPITDVPEEGVGPETRGGFQIMPYYHNSQIEEAGAPQVLTLGVDHSRVPDLEGTPPLFYGYFSLAYSVSDPDHSWICDVRIGDDPAWQPMPVLVGDLPDAFDKRNVTAFRLHVSHGPEDAEWLKQALAKDSKKYSDDHFALAKRGKEQVGRGLLVIDAHSSNPNTTYVQFFVDGQFVGLTNTAPFSLNWNTARVPDGEHEIEAISQDALGNTLSQQRFLVWVDNSNALVRTASG
jgi:hypothetical protein